MCLRHRAVRVHGRSLVLRDILQRGLHDLALLRVGCCADLLLLLGERVPLRVAVLRAACLCRLLVCKHSPVLVAPVHLDACGRAHARTHRRAGQRRHPDLIPVDRGVM